MLNVIPEMFGISPEIFVKVTNIVLLLGTIVLLKRLLYDRRYYLLMCIAICGNPLTWIHCVAGLETILYAALTVILFSLLISRWLWDSSNHPEWRKALALALTGMLLALTRPEGMLVFILPLLSTLLIRRDKSRLILMIMGMTFIFGGIYMTWRVWYWGKLFPQPFYVKQAANIYWSVLLAWLHHCGVILMLIGALFLIITIKIFKTRDLRIFSHQHSCIFIYLAMLPGLVIIYLFFMPIMNYASRFLFPGLLVAIVAAFKTTELESESATNIRYGTIMLGLAIGIATASLIQGAVMFAEEGSQLRLDGERLKITHVFLGKQLANVPYPEERALCIMDAGAVPYFSKWRTLDLVGLTSPAAISDGYVGAKWLSKCDLMILESRDGKTPCTADPDNFLLLRYPRKADLDVILKRTILVGSIKQIEGFYLLAYMRKELARTSLGEAITKAVAATERLSKLTLMN